MVPGPTTVPFIAADRNKSPMLWGLYRQSVLENREHSERGVWNPEKGLPTDLPQTDDREKHHHPKLRIAGSDGFARNDEP